MAMRKVVLGAAFAAIVSACSSACLDDGEAIVRAPQARLEAGERE